MTTCKYCGRPSQGYCCEFCWDDFEADDLYSDCEEDEEEDCDE